MHRLGQSAFLLINIRCPEDDECADYGRMFYMSERLLPDFTNATLSVAFFDIGEDVSFLSLSRRLYFNLQQLVCLFVCWQDYAKITQPLFTKFCVKVAQGPRKKPLDLGGNPDHVALGSSWL